MILLDPSYISSKVDHSFGDQSGAQIGFSMNSANLNNQVFMNKYRSLVGKVKYMTLFIDNIRLYKRDKYSYSHLEQSHQYYKDYKDRVLNEYYKENDLLQVCSQLTDMNFLIFTGFEDTPIDDYIFEKIPENVIGIYASNAISFGGKVHPIPYGIQRKLYPHDNRHQVLFDLIHKPDVHPEKNLFLCHNVGTNPNRVRINSIFEGKNWCTVTSPSSDRFDSNEYLQYLISIKKHKFMICPDGNAIGCECHRDWEVLYMKRVPIVIESEYLKKIFEGFPVLMVDDFEEVTEDLLFQSEYLFQEALNLDLSRLDMKVIFDDIIEKIDRQLL